MFVATQLNSPHGREDGCHDEVVLAKAYESGLTEEIALPHIAGGFNMALEGSTHRTHCKAPGSAAWGHDWMLSAQYLNSSNVARLWGRHLQQQHRAACRCRPAVLGSRGAGVAVGAPKAAARSKSQG